MRLLTSRRSPACHPQQQQQQQRCNPKTEPQAQAASQPDVGATRARAGGQCTEASPPPPLCHEVLTFSLTRCTAQGEEEEKVERREAAFAQKTVNLEVSVLNRESPVTFLWRVPLSPTSSPRKMRVWPCCPTFAQS